jgi:hypothetical protein
MNVQNSILEAILPKISLLTKIEVDQDQESGYYFFMRFFRRITL